MLRRLPRPARSRAKLFTEAGRGVSGKSRVFSRLLNTLDGNDSALDLVDVTLLGKVLAGLGFLEASPGRCHPLLRQISVDLAQVQPGANLLLRVAHTVATEQGRLLLIMEHTQPLDEVLDLLQGAAASAFRCILVVEALQTHVLPSSQRGPTQRPP